MATLIPITALFVGLHGLLAMLLVLKITRFRQKDKIAFGDGGNEGMQRAIRVQANFIEYVPLALIMILVLEIQGASEMLLYGLGTALFLGRVLHAYGLGKSSGATPGRFIGTLLTWAVYFVGAIACLIIAV